MGTIKRKMDEVNGNVSLSGAFTDTQMLTSVNKNKIGKAHVSDQIVSQFIIICGVFMLKEYGELYSDCLSHLHQSKVWHCADASVILKQRKIANNVKSYLPILLHCVQVKLLEHLLLTSRACDQSSADYAHLCGVAVHTHTQKGYCINNTMHIIN